MIRIFHRYIFKQVLLVSLASLSFFITVLVLGDALRDVLQKLISNQVSWSGFFQLLLLIIPGVIPYALPMGFLLAILLVLGRLSSQNEITALKAAGVHIYTIICSILFMAFLGTVLSVLINLYYAPLADTAYKRGIVNAVRQDPLRFIKPRTFIRTFPGYVIYTGEQQDGMIQDIWMWEMDANNRVDTFLKAERGSFSYDEGQEAILLNLENGSGEKRSAKTAETGADLQNPSITFQELSLALSLDKVLGAKRVDRKLAFHTLGELLEKRRETLERGATRQDPKRVAIQLEIQKKFAMAFSVFSLVAIAIPLGITASRTETSANLALALGLALSYYLLLVLISWLQKQPNLRPDLLIWIPNLIFQGVGAYWIYRMSRLRRA